MRAPTITLTITAFTTLTQLLLAEAAANPPPGQGPPQEASAICEGASVGASCSFTGPRGQIEGTCMAPQGGSELVCVPARRGPPSGAVDACAGAEAGAACSFAGPGGNVEGTCIAPEGGQGLVCAPAEGAR